MVTVGWSVSGRVSGGAPLTGSLLVSSVALPTWRTSLACASHRRCVKRPRLHCANGTYVIT
eukprot:COSAG06_NODE_4807_length_3937_cov_1.432960_2_plen_61_part_00